ncbi:MAG: glycosyltransferase family 39 protein [bacterium]
MLKKIFKIEYLWWVGLFFASVFFHANHPLNSDEGVILNGAWNLINNRQLYIDFFEFIPPASFYLIFWLWKIFGVSYFIAKFFAIIIVFLSSIGIYKISQEISKNKLNYFLPLLFIVSSVYWPIINHNTFNILFIIWAVYFFLKGLSDYSSKNFLISGLLTGLSILFLQQKGIILLFSLSSFLIILLFKEKKYNLLKLNFYFLLFTFLPLLILLKWPLKILYENLIIFPLFNYMETNKVPLYLFMLLFFVLILMVWVFRKEKSKKIWLLLYAQFFLFLVTIPRPDFYHISLILFPLYSILPISLEKMKLFNPLIKKCYYLIISLIVIIIILPLILFIFYYPFFYSIKNSKAISYIKNNCSGEYLYAGPFIPGIYFETRKLNPSPYSILITRHQTEKQFLDAREMIKKYQPFCAVLNYQIVAKFKHNKNNPVDNYVLNNYKLVFQKGDTLVYKLK